MVKPHSGFGLLEMLVVIAIIAVLVTSAVSYSATWINQGRINEFDNQLKRAFGKAKSEALKNPHGATGNEPVSAISFSGGQIVVGRCDDTNCSTLSSIWVSDIPAGINATASGSALSTIQLNSTGLLISHTTPISYNLSRGTFDDGQSPRTLY